MNNCVVVGYHEMHEMEVTGGAHGAVDWLDRLGITEGSVGGCTRGCSGSWTPRDTGPWTPRDTGPATIQHLR
jgi:hypothetical protein